MTLDGRRTTLFSQVQRTDPSHARYGEDSFSFLDRVDQPYWERIRQELERWFAEYPTDHAGDLRARFRDKDPAQHFAAWWELYLHRLFQRLGFRIDVHPTLAEVSGRPDFRITGPEGSVLLEAATTFSGIVEEGRDGTREGWILAALEEVDAPNFSVAIEFEKVGMERPKRREIIAPVEAWLSDLNPDGIKRSLTEGKTEQFEVRGWKFTLTALPVPPKSRGRPDHRVVGIGPSLTGYVNDVAMLKKTLEAKRSKYGRPEEPLVFAVLLTSPVDNEDIEQALLGSEAYRFNPEDPEAGELIRQRNGFWMRGARAQGTRVSAVLTGTSLMPWTVATAWPRLWPNPWAARPLSIKLPFPVATADERGTVSYEDRQGRPAAIFGLPDDWPGPERPFERA